MPAGLKRAAEPFVGVFSQRDFPTWHIDVSFAERINDRRRFEVFTNGGMLDGETAEYFPWRVCGLGERSRREKQREQEEPQECFSQPLRPLRKVLGRTADQ